MVFAAGRLKASVEFTEHSSSVVESFAGRFVFLGDLREHASRKPLGVGGDFRRLDRGDVLDREGSLFSHKAVHALSNIRLLHVEFVPFLLNPLDRLRRTFKRIPLLDLFISASAERFKHFKAA
jgi:hypothetical protein